MTWHLFRPLGTCIVTLLVGLTTNSLHVSPLLTVPLSQILSNDVTPMVETFHENPKSFFSELYLSLSQIVMLSSILVGMGSIAPPL